jgi:hypothetical protein
MTVELEKENAELRSELQRVSLNEQIAINNGKNFLKRIAELEKENKALGERCLQLQKDKGNLTDENNELKAQIEKMKCCKEEIIKALKETFDYEWLPAHNGKAKYLYLQTVIDIVNEKFEEIKEK